MADLPLVKDRLNEVHAVLKLLSVRQLISLSHALGIRKLPTRPVVDHSMRVKMELAAMLKGYVYDLRCGLFDVRRWKDGRVSQAQLDESNRVMEQAVQLSVMSKARRLAENAQYLKEWAQSDENELRTAAEKKFEEKALVISSGCNKVKSLLEAELAKVENIEDLVLRCRARSAKRDRNAWRDTPFPGTYKYNDMLHGMQYTRHAFGVVGRDGDDGFNQFVAGCEDYISTPLHVILEVEVEEDDGMLIIPKKKRKTSK